MNTTIQTLETENSDLKKRIQSDDIPAAVQGRGRPFKVYWVIDNWQQTVKTARHEYDFHLYSRPYYTKKPGYKLCMVVYPYGCGIGRKTHVSLFLKLMEGRYDNKLEWPCSLMFSLAIVDQMPGGRNKIKSLEPPLAIAAAGTSMQSTADMNCEWGWQMFISHDELRTRQYICNNSIKIMLQVYLN